MPVIVNDFTWRQTETTLIIHVPLHGAPQSAVDVFVSNDYIKASFEYFFFECFVLEDIDCESGRATIVSDKVIFELKKAVPRLWDDLQKKLTKQEKKELKVNALERSRELLSKQHEEKLNRNHELKRTAVSFAVEEETKQRNLIEKYKEEEKQKALGLVEEWSSDNKPIVGKKTKAVQQQYKKIYQESVKKQFNKQELPSIPLPRNQRQETKIVEVSFTPRVLPTPSRESKEEEENEWLAKQALARRTAGFHCDDLRPEEKNPHFILHKGKDFLAKSNFLAAISAFSFGIKISPDLVDFYILRSEAQFKIGNMHKCAHDCTKALEIMKPECYANLTQRVECIQRRGMALFKLGLKRQAEDEIKAAIKLQPSRELTRDLYEIMDSPEFVENPANTDGLTEIDH